MEDRCFAWKGALSELGARFSRKGGGPARAARELLWMRSKYIARDGNGSLDQCHTAHGTRLESEGLD